MRPMSRDTVLEKIAADFADAVAAGDFDSAEGWIAIAVLVAERSRAAH